MGALVDVFGNGSKQLTCTDCQVLHHWQWGMVLIISHSIFQQEAPASNIRSCFS